jgi:hypothetical protein
LPPKRRESPPETSDPFAGNPALNSILLGNNQTVDALPEDVKKDLCVKDWDPNKMTGAAVQWISDKVAEQASFKNNFILKLH